jgi:hypothetical protein
MFAPTKKRTFEKKRVLTKYSLTSHPKWLQDKGGVLFQKYNFTFLRVCVDVV